MKRCLKLILLSSLVTAAVFAAMVTPARATPPSMDSVVDDPANWTSIQNLVRSGSVGDSALYSAASGGSASAEEIIAGMEAAGAAGGLTAALPGLLAVGLSVPAAGYFGYKLGSVIDHWLPHRAWLGNTVDIPFSSWTGIEFVGEKCNGASFVGFYDTTLGLSGGINGSHVPVGCYYGAIYGLTGTYTVYEVAATGRGPSQWDDQGSTGSSPTCTGSTDCNLEAFLQRLPTVDPKLHFVQNDDISNLHQCGVGVHCWLAGVIMLPDDMAREMPASGPVTTTNPGGSPTTVPAPVNATVTTTSPEAAKVRTIIKTDTKVETYVVHILDPTDFPDDGFSKILFPAPDPNETYTDYVARLRALGYVGTITEVDETTAVDGYGPGSPTRVIDTTATPDAVYDPVLWPSPDPIVNFDDDVTIRKNTSDAVPVSTGGGGSCSCPPLDLSPLQGLSVGTSFPFGALNWIEDAMGSPTPTAFTTTLTLPDPVGSFPIDTSNTWWETTGRGIAYPVMEALITFAFFFVFATRILGMGKADED